MIFAKSRIKLANTLSIPDSNNGTDENVGIQPIGRIGVYGVDGITEPQTGTIPVSYVPIPPTLRQKITTAISRGKNLLPSPLAYSDASLKAMNVVPILLNQKSPSPLPLPLRYEDLSGGSLERTDLRVARGVTVATYSFSAMPVSSTVKDGRLVVKVLDLHPDLGSSLLTSTR